MGDWYVIANIPTFVEKGAHSAKESYVLQPDGTIATTFTFRADSFDGPAKDYHSKGFVLGEHGAVWASSTSGRSRPTIGSRTSLPTTARR